MTSVVLLRQPSIQEIVAFSGAKAQNVEWLAEDIDFGNEASFPSGRNLMVRLEFGLSSAVEVQITYDSGDSWSKLVAGAAGRNKVDIMIGKTDKINLRTND